MVGCFDGSMEGLREGATIGTWVGDSEIIKMEGLLVGFSLGLIVGIFVG